METGFELASTMIFCNFFLAGTAGKATVSKVSCSCLLSALNGTVEELALVDKAPTLCARSVVLEAGTLMFPPSGSNVASIGFANPEREAIFRFAGVGGGEMDEGEGKWLGVIWLN